MMIFRSAIHLRAARVKWREMVSVDALALKLEDGVRLKGENAIEVWREDKEIRAQI